jgi:hypothetical protein
MARWSRRLLAASTVAAGATAGGYVGLVTGACPLDLGIGRRVRPLGPQHLEVAAPREAVFDLIAEPYLLPPDKRGGVGLGWPGGAAVGGGGARSEACQVAWMARVSRL